MSLPSTLSAPWNVLVLPAASEIGLEIHRALSALKEVTLHGAQQPGPSVAAFHYARLHALPPIYDADCLPQLKELIDAHKIDAIFPAHDDVLVWLARHAPVLAAKVIAPTASVCELCRSKRATYRRLDGIVTVPKVYSDSSAVRDYPKFVKPDRGNASRRARKIDSRDALDHTLVTELDLIVMEYLPGAEYTIDCFSQNGKLLFSAARERQETRGGIATVTATVDLPYVQEWAERIGTTLGINGAWFFQIKENALGAPCLLEVAPRISGSMALSRAQGPNFPLLALYDAFAIPVTVEASAPAVQTMGRSLDVAFTYGRPVDAVYIDLDDTLILRDQVNLLLMPVIFQCHNRGVPVHLITRHRRDIAETLAKYRLTGLFDKIIPISDPARHKADFITEADAVLIDDSFSERHHALTKRGIVCFDAASAVALLDMRR